MIVSYTLIASCLLAASLSAPVQTPDYAPKNSVKIVLDCAAYLCTNNLTLADLNNSTQPIQPKPAYNVTSPVQNGTSNNSPAPIHHDTNSNSTAPVQNGTASVIVTPTDNVIPDVPHQQQANTTSTIILIPSSTSSTTQTPSATPAKPTFLSVGNVQSSDQDTHTGGSGFFGGDSGGVDASGNGVNNNLTGNGSQIDKAEVGNALNVSSDVKTGNGRGWGSSGGQSNVGNSINNSATGAQNTTVGSLNVGNTIATSQDSNTGNAGSFGGNSGQIENSGNGQDNHVNLAPDQQGEINGAVGTVQGSGSSTSTGSNGVLSFGGQTGSVKGSGNGLGNTIN
ncbi:hypothetical protein MIR68_010281 [Amoeboaphelidium protococcarum]|nr:hypothetical protein MIR68_010281 [Amoeboaphelidium protococcarum]